MNLNFLKESQKEFLQEGNYHIDQTIEERFEDIVNKVREYEEKGYPEGLSDRIQYLLENNILSLSTPVIANFGKKNKDGSDCKNLPASCNIVTVGNSIYDIYSCNREVAMLSKRGAGVGIDFSYIVEKGTKVGENFYSNSKLDWIRALIDTSQKVSQNGVRRGYATPFESIEDVEIPDLYEAIDKNNPNKNDVLVDNTVGIKIPTGFMNKLENGDTDSRKSWLGLLDVRAKSGQAYVSFVENMNKNCSEVYRKLKLDIDQTNICTEFIQPHMEGYTPVCVISALNLIHWDYIKVNPSCIKDAIYFLNIVNDEYVRLSENQEGLEKAHAAARDKRDIGLGTLGLHSLFQSKDMAFGDMSSRMLNREIYSTMQKYSIEATEELADTFGPCEIAAHAGLNRYNCSLMMVAPNKSTSFFCTVDKKGRPASLGIEPYFSNMFVKRLAKIQYLFKNPYLEKILESRNKNTFEIWESISDNLGSVQHLDFLTDSEKNVFKTFVEISPKDIIDLASDRQTFIDMGQSLNLVNRPNYTKKDLHQIHKYAFDKGIKTLYYLYPAAHAAIERDGGAWDNCVACAD